MNNDEAIVLSIIRKGKVTQRQIAMTAEWLGCHPVHEADINLPDKMETTLRNIRQIIRDLRLIHRKPILSDKNGYWYCEDVIEAQAYLERLERTAKAQAKAHMLTYNSMKLMFNIRSDYFEKKAAAENTKQIPLF